MRRGGGGDADGDGDGATAVNQEEDTGQVSVAGAPSGVEGDAIQSVIEEHINAEAEYVATYTGSDGFEQNVIIQIEGGTPPDIGLFPQPGTVIEQAAQGNAVALEDLGFELPAYGLGAAAGSDEGERSGRAVAPSPSPRAFEVRTAARPWGPR